MLMPTDDTTNLEELMDATLLLQCANCQEQTLHSIDTVLDVFGPASKLLTRCTHCDQEQETWDVS